MATKGTASVRATAASYMGSFSVVKKKTLAICEKAR
ncbi:protein of unknown function [Pseudodesulfovibrio piezophilus C1TLV30]|uniref:Uncharacterized protein n=1 Tax=Pseudodesulfovibrio piezophilus (strain DSM 21447 / JCM 15486 / C1TLV30) TaxID=1322246 RepID=M1WM22_PSEP2|nr:protein of unknown function [Pseudodesulfovibrio piezophilus C1TLV30]